jgi:hypothetical protein
MFVDPITDEEWQEVVNEIAVLRVIDAARQYGLITGGPELNHDRCYELLAKAREKDIYPRNPSLRYFLGDLSESG